MANQEINNGVSRLNLPAETESAKAFLFNLMTSDESGRQFTEMTILPWGLWERTVEIKEIASMMKLYPELFMTIIRNKNGCERMQQIFGPSKEANDDFCSAILSHFVPIMTDRCTFPVVLHAMKRFDQEPVKRLYDSTLESVVHIACSEGGCIAIMRIMHYGKPEYKNQLLAKIAVNAFDLSKDTYGSVVIQSELRYAFDDRRLDAEPLFASLHGRCVDLSFTKPGSNVVEHLLEDSTIGAMLMVVWEILGCRRDVFRALATDEYGSHVVHTALTVTLKRTPPILLYSPLITMLLPLSGDLLRSGRHAILKILNSATWSPYN